MSEIVHYRGKLHKVEKFDYESLEDLCKRLLNNQELDKYYGSYKEMLLEQCYDAYIERNNVIYEVSKHSLDPDEDIYIISDNADGTLDFEVKYYNGGCCLTEAIEEAFNNMDK